VKMEVEYKSEMSESLYQNARCHTPHHRNTETKAFVTGREEKWVVWVVPRLLSVSCNSLCKNLSQFSRKVVDTVRSVGLKAPFKVALTDLLVSARLRLGPQATLFGQEPNKNNDIHLAVRVLR
jgi:hypothetical protein